MDQPITRAEHEEFRRRLEEENSRQDRRIALLEESVSKMGALSTSVEKLALSMESMVKEQEKQGKRLETLEDRDGEMWRKAVGYVVTAVIGVFLGYVFTQLGFDMYPQFWTPRIGGIFMKYSYEYKKNCIELYRQGKWPETPDGIKQENFRISVRRWSRREKSCGAESLQKNQKKMWSADEKYELIAKVLAGVSITESAISAGVEPSLLSQWVRCYKMKGYQGLAAQRKGRPPKEPDDMKKKIVPAELTPSEREELIRLRAENEYLRTENEVIKKRIALRREKFAAQLKAKKLHSSKNSEEKDTL